MFEEQLGLVKDIWRSRLGGAIRGLMVLIAVSTLGFWFLGHLHEQGLIDPPLPDGKHWSLLDSLYFVTITVATIGYGETISATGNLVDMPDVRIFTIIVIVLSMIAVAYFLSAATAFFVEGDLRRVLERRRMQSRIAALNGHFIVCGAGQTGRHIAEELAASGKPFVVIDLDPAQLEALPAAARELTIVGDGSKDETLQEAGIERAHGLAAALADDKDNLFLTISARQLNPSIRIVSKAVDPHTRTKLLKAGADGVVSPNFIGGLRMASELVRPAVVSFLDTMLRNREAPVRFSEVTCGAKVAGLTLKEADVTSRTGLVIIAIREPAREVFDYNPTGKTVLQGGATLVVVGTSEQVTSLEKLVDAQPGGLRTVKDATRRLERKELEARPR